MEEVQHIAELEAPCCPFQTTPGRANGGWTDCIHGMIGRKKELLRELEELDNRIFLWQVETGIHMGGI